MSDYSSGEGNPLSLFIPGSYAAPLDQKLMERLRLFPLDALEESIDLLSLIRVAQEVTGCHFNRNITPFEATSFPGWEMTLFAPLYLSNFCINHCSYCGFRAPGAVQRVRLSVPEALDESRFLLDYRFRNILLVAGESPTHVPIDYLCEIIDRLAQSGVQPAIEIAPQSVEDYRRLVEVGCLGLTLFQETYQPDYYRRYHPKGPKSDYRWRLESQRRAALAGMKRIGFGFLVGLAPAEEELNRMIAHAREIATEFPQAAIAFSLPRLHRLPDGSPVPFPVTPEMLVRMFVALRLSFPDSHLVLSTREDPHFRDQLASVAVTWMSAASSTRPGGYRGTGILDGQISDSPGHQFAIADHRSIKQVTDALVKMNHQIVWS